MTNSALTTASPAPKRNPNGLQPVKIEGSDRVFLCGMTGSGKTFWAMHMLAALPRLIVVDSKHSDEIAKWDWRDGDKNSVRLLERGRAVRVRVHDDGEALDWMGRAYHAGGTVVYIDEVVLLVPQGTRSPIELQQIWRAGRERGVGGWVATQRPSWLPRELLSEAEWSVMFRLKLEDDRKTMAKDGGLGDVALQPITDEHGFLISRVNWEKPQYYSALSAGMKVEKTAAQEKEPAHA